MDCKKTTAFFYIFIAIYILLISPWNITDPDELSHMATGRYIFNNMSVPKFDPFTFTNPNKVWSNPEWLGDLLFYAVFHYFGTFGLHLFKLLVISLGWILALKFARIHNASIFLALCSSTLLLIYSLTHFTLRNRIHALWLIPLYLLILEKHARKKWLLFLLIPAGILWANLHSSFILGWLIVGAYALHHGIHQPSGKGWRMLLLICLIHPILALISPFGIHNYDQLFDHFYNIDIYKKYIIEWTHINLAKDPTSYLPFHFLGLAGLLSFLPRLNRRRINLFLIFTALLIMCYSSNRFTAILALIGTIVISINISPYFSGLSHRTKSVISPALLLLVAALIWPKFLESRNPSNNLDLLNNKLNKYSHAIDFLNNNAPEGSRVFNSYNYGPFLLWYMKDKSPFKIYIDPRNNLGAKTIKQYRDTLLEDSAQLEAEVDRHHINLVLVSLENNLMYRLNAELGNNSNWHLVFFDGNYAVYAKENRQNRNLIDTYKYQIIKASTGFEYLLPHLLNNTVHEAPLKRELLELDKQAPNLTHVLEAYKLLNQGGYPPPLIKHEDTNNTQKALELLKKGCPHLGPSPERLIYFACCFARQKDWDTCNQILNYADTQFPNHYMVLALKLELARLDNNREKIESHLSMLQSAVPRNHFIWRILYNPMK